MHALTNKSIIYLQWDVRNATETTPKHPKHIRGKPVSLLVATYWGGTLSPARLDSFAKVSVPVKSINHWSNLPFWRNSID